MSKHTTEGITLYRQPLPQAPAVHTVLPQPGVPGRAVEYVRINYFSSAATAEVMKVSIHICCFLCHQAHMPGAVPGSVYPFRIAP